MKIKRHKHAKWKWRITTDADRDVALFASEHKARDYMQAWKNLEAQVDGNKNGCHPANPLEMHFDWAEERKANLSMPSQTVNRAVIRRIRDGKYQAIDHWPEWVDLEKAFVFRSYHHAKHYRTKGTEILPVKLTISETVS